MKKKILDMKESLKDVYLIILFVVYNLILVDVNVFGMSLKLAMLLLITVVTVMLHTIRQSKQGIEFNLSHFDISICIVGGCAFVVLVYKLIANPLDYRDAITILTLCLVYYLIRVRKEPIKEDILLVFSASNAVISLMLLWHYVVNPETSLPIKAIVEDQAILSWLILMITVNVMGFCVYEGKQIWYGINAIGGFLLLFIQKNIIAIGIIGILFLILPLVYTPTRRLIKNAMQMFFVYTFLRCNMSLITGYTGLIKIEVTYNLEISVYMELLLALFGVFFFHYWDKNTTEEDDDKKLLPEMKTFFQKTLIVVGMMWVVLVTAVIKGSTDIMPEILAEIIVQGRLGIAGQTGIFEMVAQRYGMIGVAITLYLYYAVIRVLVMKKKTKVSKHQKIFRVVTGIFVIQSMFLTQTMVTLPLYMVFIITFLKDTDIYEKKVRGEDTNEVNYSDSML